MTALSRIVDRNDEVNSVITTTTSSALPLDRAEMLSVQCVIDVDTPAAAVFTAAASDICTAAAHGYTTGLKGQASSDTTLPAGLAAVTDYFVIVLSANTFSLASSLVNALAGTAIDITDAGTGVHTFTPTALAGGSVKLEKSNDGSNWSDVAAATAVTADAVVWFEIDRPKYKYARLSYTLTAGRMSSDNYVFVRGS